MTALRNLQQISRADFLTGVGLYLLSDRLVMARLRKNLLQVSMLEQEVRELPERLRLWPIICFSAMDRMPEQLAS
jgi:hypothetical protein